MPKCGAVKLSFASAITKARFVLSAVALLALASVSQAGESTLTWTAPTQNEDGTPYTDPSHYTIRVGCQQSGQYEEQTVGPIPYTQTSIVISALPEQTDCYFVATATNQSGIESAYSGEATKFIDSTAALAGPVENLVVTWQESSAMTISYLGYDYYQSSSSAELTDTMTVPAGADFVAIIFTGYSSGNDLWPLTSGTFGGETLVAQTGANYNGGGAEFIGVGGISGHIAIYTAVGSFSTSEDLVYDLATGISEGVGVIAMFFSGVDQTTPVAEAETQAAKDTNISGLTAGADTYTIGGAYAYNQAPACSGSGQTQVTSGTYNSAGHCAGYEENSTTFDVTNTSYTRVAAIVINAAPVQTTVNYIEVPWTPQPPKETKVNWSHPLMQKATFVYCPNNYGESLQRAFTPDGVVYGTEAGTGDPLYWQAGGNTQPQAGGVAFQGINFDDLPRGLTFPMRPEYSPADSQLSMYWLGEMLKPEGGGGNDYWWVIDTSSDNTDGWRVLKYVSPADNIRFRLPAGGNNDYTTGGWSAGDTKSMAFTYDDVTQRTYEDGVQVVTRADAGVDITTAATTLSLFDANDNSYAPGNGYRLLILWNRPLTASEVEQIHDNPWQIFEPQLIPCYTAAAAEVAGLTQTCVEVPWTTPPPVGTPLDMGNKFAQGLAGAVVPTANGYKDLVTGLVLTNPATFTTKINGVGLTHVNAEGTTGFYASTTDLNLPAWAPVTLVWVFDAEETIIQPTTAGWVAGLGGTTGTPNMAFGHSTSANYRYGFENHTVSAPWANDSASKLPWRSMWSVEISNNNRKWYMDDARSKGTSTATKTYYSRTNIAIGHDPHNWSGSPGNSNVVAHAGILAWWSRILTEAEITEFHQNPWQIFEPQLIPVFSSVAGGGAIELVVAEALQSMTADNVALTQSNTLVLADTTQSVAADNIALTQKHTLAVAESLLSMTTDNVALTQKATLAVADALLSQTADNLVLTSAGTLSVADALLALSSDNIDLTQKHTLAVAEALLSVTTDPIALTQKNTIAVADALQSMTADNLELVGAGTLVVAEALLSVTTDPIALTQKNTLAVADALQTITTDGIALTQKHSLLVDDALLAMQSDNVVLSTTLLLSVAEALLSITVDTPALIQKNTLAIAEALLSMTADPITLETAGLLAVQSALMSMSANNLDLTQKSLLVVADALQSMTVDEPLVAPTFSLTLQDALLSIGVDSVALTQKHVLATDDALMALTADNAVLTPRLIVNDALMNLVVDSIVLGRPPEKPDAIFVVDPNDAAHRSIFVVETADTIMAFRPRRRLN